MSRTGCFLYNCAVAVVDCRLLALMGPSGSGKQYRGFPVVNLAIPWHYYLRLRYEFWTMSCLSHHACWHNDFKAATRLTKAHHHGQCADAGTNATGIGTIDDISCRCSTHVQSLL